MSVSTAAATTRRDLTFVAILALFALEPTLGFLTSNIANIIVAYDIGPGEATWVITAASLVMIPVAIVGGAIAGRWVSYRTLALFGIGVYTVAGVLPLFMGENFALLIAARAIWGLGAGLNFTLANSLIAVSYRDEQVRARMFGLGNVVFSVTAVLSTIAGGYLATISWQAPFAGFFVGVVSFALVLFLLREPDITAQPAAEVSRKGTRIPLIAWLPLGVFAVGIIAIYPLISLNSVFFSQASLGGVDLVGLVGAIPTVIGFFVSLVFARTYRRLGAWVLPLGMLLAAAGMLVVFAATAGQPGNLALYCLGFAIVGAGMMGITIGVPMVLTTIVPPRAASLTQGLFAAALNLGAVISSFYITAATAQFGGADGAVRPVLAVSAVILLVLALPLVALAVQRVRARAVAESVAA